MDEMGILALYTMIGNNQSERDPMTISKVKEIMDQSHGPCRERLQKAGKKKEKPEHTDELIVLQEKDFEV